jgi:hypothetical protein
MIASRLTPHVRHREKYVDVPVSAERAFVFTRNGQPSPRRARTLRQFVTVLETTSRRCSIRTSSAGIFSRWIADVFGDRALADELRGLEERHRTRARADTLAEMAGAVPALQPGGGRNLSRCRLRRRAVDRSRHQHRGAGQPPVPQVVEGPVGIGQRYS